MAVKLSTLTGYQRYCLDGFTIKKFKNTDTLKTLKDSLFEIQNENLQDGFSLVEKYTNTKDLRPEAFEYNSSFIDILMENDIPELIQSHIGKELTLNHIQIRVSDLQPAQSYMPWHRDVYVQDDELIGCMPPAHKIIFYPKEESLDSRACIALAKGSHLCVFQNQKTEQFILPGFSVYDDEILKISNIATYSSSDDEFLMFNTGMLHHVIPGESKKRSVRIIYSFVEKHQFDKIFSDKRGHFILNNAYENAKAAKYL